MIDLYTWNTPNGRKATIMLEELGQEYTLHPVNIGKGEQKASNYLSINPNGRIPALFDSDTSARVFESGAILIYLAEKFRDLSESLLPSDAARRAEVLSWTYWQTGGLGPMLGQFNHFTSIDSPASYAVQRFEDESFRLLEVLNTRLNKTKYLGGNEYSIADIMNFPWVSVAIKTIAEANKEKFTRFESIMRWHSVIEKRPAVIKGLDRLANLNSSRY
ncbi:glutathione S-transferase N-terminal domain-containing protein [Alteromonas macleodii]|uniref:glutathione S-transferase N-terminal domain-containing protein n=1 Tax=Alteromonas macleodii TaxID=28108 RepID=UPI00207690E6|nr:glutathione S-transferase N-terminal domain-containing protein [Alteromonas macleodii]USI28970.1 glutathione S-transferase N-terminal domain-containing protein [Alteromonas macleodii]